MNRAERQWSWRIDECKVKEILTELNQPCEGATTELKLRLVEIAGQASEEQLPILKRHSDEVRHDKEELCLQKFTYSVPLKECQSLLISAKVQVPTGELNQRKALGEFLNTSTGTRRETFIEMAEEFVAKQEIGAPSAHSTFSGGRRGTITQEDYPNLNSSGLHNDAASGSPGRNVQLEPPDLRQPQFSSYRGQPIGPTPIATLMDTIRKWNHKFAGTKQPMDAILFLENVVESCDC